MGGWVHGRMGGWAHGREGRGRAEERVGGRVAGVVVVVRSGVGADSFYLFVYLRCLFIYSLFLHVCNCYLCICC